MPDNRELTAFRGRAIAVWSVTKPEVRIHGDVAWMTYVNEGSVKDASGTKNATWLESALLRKENRDWRIEFFHSTRVPGA